MNNVNLFPALTTPIHLFFFQTCLLHLKLFEGKLSLAEGIATFIGHFLPKLPN